MRKWFWIVGCLALVFWNIPNTPMEYRVSQKAPFLNAPAPPPPASPVFRDATLSSGLHFIHWQGGQKLEGLDETTGSGACVLDYDNDGWMDLFLVNGSGQSHFYRRTQWWQKPVSSALYRNESDGTFQEVTEGAGLRQTRWGMGCVTGDLDNDGDSDLFLTTLGQNVLYRNNGDGTFTEVTTASGIQGEGWSTSAVLADYDQDGLLDIYVVNYLSYPKGAHTFERDSGFQASARPSFDPTLFNSLPNQLYHNRGGLVFEEVAQSAGVEDASGRGLAALWLDVNQDGYPDLVVSNDKGFPNSLFINLQNGRFQPADFSSRKFACVVVCF